MYKRYLIKIILFLIILTCNLRSEGDVFKVELKNIGSDTSTNIIEWTGVNSPYSGSWKVANQYYEVTYLTNHTIYTGWGLQMITTNRALDANPRYIGTGDPAGLISTLSSNLTLPIIWMAVSSPFITNISGETQTTYPPTPALRGDGSGFDNWTWRWLMDKNSQGFTNYNENGYNEYSLVWDQGGFAYHEFFHQYMPSKIYLYFGADFHGATIQTYRTTKLLLEQFHTSDTEYLKNFWIYTNHGNGYHHYCPSGWHGNISLTTNFDDYHSPPTCCNIKLGLEWAGLWWNEPAEVGDDPKGYTNKGYNLTGTQCIEFWTKSSNGNPEITFGVGRDEDSCGGSCQRDITLSTNWTLYGIKLTNKDLSHVSGGFRVTGWDKKCTIYLDDVKFKSTINPVFTSIIVTPGSTNVLTNQQAQFTATGKDQYGDDIAIGSVDWSVSGDIGTIGSTTGLLVADTTAGNGQVIATSESISGFANVTVYTLASSWDTNIYKIFCETCNSPGMKLGVNNLPDEDGGNYGCDNACCGAWQWLFANETTTSGEWYEGGVGFQVEFAGSGNYWGWANFSFGCTEDDPTICASLQEKDLSNFSSGTLQFWYKATNDFYIELEGPHNIKTKKAINRDWGYSLDGNWYYISQNLNQFSINYARVVCPFKIIVSGELTGEQTSAVKIFVDGIKWKK